MNHVIHAIEDIKEEELNTKLRGEASARWKRAMKHVKMKNGVTRRLNVFNGPLPRPSVRKFQSRLNLLKKIIHLKKAFTRFNKDVTVAKTNENNAPSRGKNHHKYFF